MAETFAKLEKRSANTLVATRARDRVDRFHYGRFAFAVELDRTRCADSFESFDGTAGIPHLPQLLEQQLAIVPPDFDHTVAAADSDARALAGSYPVTEQLLTTQEIADRMPRTTKSTYRALAELRSVLDGRAA